MYLESGKSPNELALAHAKRLIAVTGLEEKFSMPAEDVVPGDGKSPYMIFSGLYELHRQSGGGVLGFNDIESLELAKGAVEAYCGNRFAIKVTEELKNKVSSWLNESGEVPLTNSIHEARLWKMIRKMFGGNAFEDFGEAFKKGITKGQIGLLDGLQAEGTCLMPFRRDIFVALTGQNDDPNGVKDVLGTGINGIEVEYEYRERSLYPHMNIVVQPI